MSVTSAASLSKGVIAFGTSAFTANLLDWDWDEIAREAIDVSHQKTAAADEGEFGNKPNLASYLVNPGKLKMKIAFNPDTLPPIGAVAETITLTCGDATVARATWVGTGFMTSFKVTGALEDQMTADCEVQFTGNVTRTAGS